MTVEELKERLASIDGAFSLAAGALGVKAVETLFDDYLPSGTLAVDDALPDIPGLAVDGRMTLGSAKDAPVRVAFVTDQAEARVLGIRITLSLDGWAMESSGIRFDLAAVGHVLHGPHLTLRAGGGDPDLTAPAALVGGSVRLDTPHGPRTPTLVASLPPADESRPHNLTMEVDLDDVTLSDLGALAQLLPGGKFDVIPPEIPVADALSLSRLTLVVDPVDNVLLLLGIDVRSARPLVIREGVFEIDEFTFTFMAQTPTLSPNLFASVSAIMSLGGERVTVSLSLPDLYLQGALSRQTPLPLRPFLSHFFPVDFIPEDFELRGLGFGLNLKGPHDYLFDLELDNLWSIPLADSVSLDFQRLLVDVSSPGATAVPAVSVQSRWDLGGTPLYLSASEEQGAWSFQGGTVGLQAIDFVPLGRELASALHLPPLPDSLTALQLRRVDVGFDTGDKHFRFECAGLLEVSDARVATTLNVDVKPATGTHPFEAALNGHLTLSTPTTEVAFDLEVRREGRKTLLLGTVDAETSPLELRDLFHGLGFEADIPEGLDIALEDLGVLYETEVDAETSETRSTFIVTAKSKAYGKALVVARKAKSSTTYLFAAEPPIHGSLAELPLVGRSLPPQFDLALEGLRVLLASRPLGKDDLTELNALLAGLAKHLPGDEWKLPAGPLTAPADLDLDLRLGTTARSVSLPLGKHRALALPSAAPASAWEGGPAAGSGRDPAVWLSVQKTLGPLFVGRVGFGYAKGGLEVLLDASLSFSAVAISLDGLGLRTPLTAFEPSFALKGMGLSLKLPALEISGAFLSTTPGGLADDDFEYAGQVVIRAAGFAISGIGAYGRFAGDPSFFAFVSLDVPLGGPPFFFVTGLAAGFGYNRSVRVPALKEVPPFPLVASAMAGETGKDPFAGKRDDPGAALSVLDRDLPVAVGEDWLAVGVRFTSFEMIRSFALLTVSFGTRFEVALLGLSAVTVPRGAEEPVGYAQLALRVVFSPDDGLLSAEAQLTPASYVLAKACHLTGGFALYVWSKDQENGARAGDFVVSLGGYHPGFQRPEFYPVVPRLGANWKVDDCLRIKGGLYFALTPSSVMAGGYLNATWQSGNLKAWFDAHADFLLSWKPFHYQVSLGLSLGASYKLDLGFASHTFTVHLGVDLDLWGPPFAGRVHVDLTVISFTVEFGPERAPVKPISWADFKGSFLPPVVSAGALAPASAGWGAPEAGEAPTPQPTDTYCTIQVADGLLKDLSRSRERSEDPDWVVNADALRLATRSVFPCTGAALVTGSGSAGGGDSETPVEGDFPRSFGVGPVGIADGRLDSEHRVTLHRLTGDVPDHAYRVPCVVRPVTGNVPGAPWSRALSLDLVENPSISTVNAAPATIDGVLVGVEIVPASRRPHALPEPIDVDALRESPAAEKPTFAWSAPEIPTTDPFDPSTAMETLMSTVADPTVARAREAVLGALRAQGLDVEAEVSVRG
ncbi:MAG TPA: DUF6603 domain-containing protein, partial [Longimicrobiales bacterium]